MKKIKFFLILTLVLGIFTSVSCVRETTTIQDEFQAVLDNALKSYKIKGISAAVLIPGQNIWRGVSGISHESTPIVPEMLFRIASITKNYVAAMVLKLAEEGVLNLEDPIDSWLPTYTNINGNVTIRQLLNHTSGIYNLSEHPTVWDIARKDPNRFWTSEEVIMNFVLEPYFKPGDGWHYSDTNYKLLGMIIKEAAQSELSMELRRNFFDPGGFKHTFFDGEENITDEMAHGWYDLDSDDILDDFSNIPRIAINSIIWPACGLVTTAEDLAKWASDLFTNGILLESSIDEMVNFISFSGSSTTGYGLGSYRFSYFGKTLWGHTGGDVDFSSVMFFLPENGTTFVVMVNQVEESISLIAADLLNVYLNYE